MKTLHKDLKVMVNEKVYLDEGASTAHELLHLLNVHMNAFIIKQATVFVFVAVYCRFTYWWYQLAHSKN